MPNMKPTIDCMIGKKFGKLFVEKWEGKNKHNQKIYLCKCECGKSVTVSGISLRSGHTKSCGCNLIAYYKSGARKRHESTRTKLYRIWASMKQRCTNSSSNNYARYGKRGIKVCDEWMNSFECFRDWALQNGYKQGLSIDRINNDGNYCPSNCRWATAKEQCNNTSRTVKIEFDGETKSISEWAETLGVHPTTMRSYVRAHNKTYQDYIAWKLEATI